MYVKEGAEERERDSSMAFDQYLLHIHKQNLQIRLFYSVLGGPIRFLLDEVDKAVSRLYLHWRSLLVISFGASRGKGRVLTGWNCLRTTPPSSSTRAVYIMFRMFIRIVGSPLTKMEIERIRRGRNLPRCPCCILDCIRPPQHRLGQS